MRRLEDVLVPLHAPLLVLAAAYSHAEADAVLGAALLVAGLAGRGLARRVPQGLRGYREVCRIDVSSGAAFHDYGAARPRSPWPMEGYQCYAKSV